MVKKNDRNTYNGSTTHYTDNYMIFNKVRAYIRQAKLF